MIKVQTQAIRGDEYHRGIFSFVDQFLSNCKYFYDLKINFKMNFDLNKKTGYYDTEYKKTDNVWEYYFNKNFEEQPDQIVEWIGNYDYHYEFNYNDQEKRFICKELIEKHLSIKNEIILIANSFYRNNIKKNSLGVHVRGTDIEIHHQKIKFEKYFKEIDALLNQYETIFLCSDEYQTIDVFKNKYGNKIITYESKTLSKNNVLPEYKQNGKNKYKMGEDVIVESLLLSKTDFLLKGKSNMSNFSLLYNPLLQFKNLQ